MRTYSLSFVAGQEWSQNIAGNMFRIALATETLEVSFDGKKAITMETGQGVKFDRDSFEKVTITSALAQDIIIIAGFGDFLDNNQQVSVTTSATIAPGNTLDNVAFVTAVKGAPASGGAYTQLYPATATVKTVLIKNRSGNTGNINVGTTGAGAASGYELEPGESLSLSTTAAIGAFNPSEVNDVVVCVLPVRDV